MDWIIENWETVLAIYGGLVAVATMIVKLTPSQKDDAVLGWFIKALNFFSTVNPKPKV